MSAIHYSNLNIEGLEYRKELNVNKTNGAKSAYVSTAKGGNDPSNRIRIQLGQYESGEFMRSVYGLSAPLAGQTDNNRRALDLSIDSDEMLKFLQTLDAKNKQAAKTNTMEWFKKQISDTEVDAFYTPIVKPSTKAEYRPTARTKVVVDTERINTQIFVVNREGNDGAKNTIEEYIPGSINDISRGGKCIPIVEISGLWFAQKSFGMSLVVTHLLVWPGRSTLGIDAFMLPSVPRMAASTDGSSFRRNDFGGFLQQKGPVGMDYSNTMYDDVQE